MSECSPILQTSRNSVSLAILPILLFLAFPCLLLTYFGISAIPTQIISSLLPLSLALRIPLFLSQVKNRAYCRLFLYLLAICVLYIAASSFSFGSLKEVFVFILSNLVAGSLLGCAVGIPNIRFMSILFIGYFLMSLLSLFIFLSLSHSHHFISGIIQIEGGNNDLYQTFGAYFLRSSFLPFSSFLVFPKYFSGHQNKLFRYYPIMLFLGLSIGAFLLFVLGAKKDLFLLLTLLLIVTYSLFPSRFRILLITALVMISLHYFPTLLVNYSWQEVYDYTIKRFMFSLEARYGEPIFDTFFRHLSPSFPLGDPHAHLLFDENYIHSSLLSAFVSTGLIGGLLFIAILVSFLCVLPKIPFCLAFPSLLVVVVSICSTTFSWLLLWFFLGFSFALAITPATVSGPPLRKLNNSSYTRISA
jgi:hypothetical protein